MTTKKTKTAAEAVADTSAFLSAEDLLKVGELKRVDIPELGGHVFLRQLPAGAILDMMALPEGQERNEYTTKLLAQAVANEQGDFLFTVEDAGRLRQMRMDVYNRLQDAMTEDMVRESKEDSAGNDSGETSG